MEYLACNSVQWVLGYGIAVRTCNLPWEAALVSLGKSLTCCIIILVHDVGSERKSSSQLVGAQGLGVDKE